MYELEKKVSIDQEGKFLFERIEFGGMQIEKEEGNLDKNALERIERIMSDADSFPLEPKKKKSTYWKSEIEFQSGEKIVCVSTNFSHKLYKLLFAEFEPMMNDKIFLKY